MFRRLFTRFLPAPAENSTDPDTPFVPIRDGQGRVTGVMDRS